MIKTRDDLKYYMEEDRKAYHKLEKQSLKDKIIEKLYPDTNYEFMKCLRKLEFQINRGGSIRYYYHRKHAKLRAKTGIELNPNVAGPGLHISHGKVVISSAAVIGSHCKILSDVTIGGQGRYDVPGAPIIGNRVFIGSGAKIIGNISIADECVIGANAVVIHSVTEKGITLAGNPAKKISENDSLHYLKRV